MSKPRPDQSSSSSPPNNDNKETIMKKITKKSSTTHSNQQGAARGSNKKSKITKPTIRAATAKKVSRDQFRDAVKVVRTPPSDPNGLVSAVRTLTYMYERSDRKVKEAILDAVFAESESGTWIAFVFPLLKHHLELWETEALAEASTALNDLVGLGAGRRHGRSIIRMLDACTTCYGEAANDS